MIRVILQAPKTICIYRPETTSSTYAFLKDINRIVLRDGNWLTIDLSKVEKITAAASVLLFATINTCQLMSDSPAVIRCIFPKNDQNVDGHRYIVKTGLSRALSSGTTEKLKDLTKSQIFYQSSDKATEILFPTLQLLTRETALTESQLHLLIAGISEAMLNVQHHAYKKINCDKQIDPVKLDIVKSIGERWWQCAWYDSTQEAWIFIICDIGLGVVETYSRALKHIGLSIEASTALKNAFLVGNSRFVGSGRGNGSEDMKRPVEQGAREQLLVYTSGYRYLYRTGMNEPEITTQEDYFHGTLIQWTLYAKGEK